MIDINKKVTVSLLTIPNLKAECVEVANETTAIINQVYSTIILN
jgi:hypothetical protein